MARTQKTGQQYRKEINALKNKNKSLEAELQLQKNLIAEANKQTAEARKEAEEISKQNTLINIESSKLISYTKELNNKNLRLKNLIVAKELEKFDKVEGN